MKLKNTLQFLAGVILSVAMLSSANSAKQRRLIPAHLIITFTSPVSFLCFGLN